MSKTMLITPKHKSIEKLFDKSFWEDFVSDAVLLTTEEN
uniref:Uncharacterized protein n=1 Tax=uncultured bacterium contig00031 TaxID=1181520 RepID=A0A806K085_9BACT|nr:hypothetical protein [uncultured bacterium contig00031]